jgi:hypothetical protein
MNIIAILQALGLPVLPRDSFRKQARVGLAQEGRGGSRKESPWLKLRKSNSQGVHGDGQFIEVLKSQTRKARSKLLPRFSEGTGKM